MLHLLGGRSVPAEPGDTILSALRREGEKIQSVCGGRAMCGTCRLAIDDLWLDRLAPPQPQEARLLRILKAGAPNHRLACQTMIDARHDGLSFNFDPPPIRVISKETAI